MTRRNAPAHLERPVRLGVIGAAHGTRGELRVKCFTDDPMALGAYGPLHTADGRSLTVAAIRAAKGVAIVSFAGIDDRNKAENLRGEALFVDRSVLPEDLEEEEYYYADLVGLAVVDQEGEEVGSIVSVHNFGAGDILEIRPGSGATVMIPFTQDAVPRIDLAQKRILIDRTAAGLAGAEEAPPAEAEATMKKRKR
ncbi:ribosome maturation factor RimM [Chelativorans sp. Marseille-P2723]|uniref:ribosome maturation factor RimM n=1 Tax=Chelativorans sp. Marseille-P2723 TaxID=2709133 RepID=UPI0015701876|nr:ribosome maturation factor RimM [Chelativorans sp. Marseille-P2723]